MKLRYVVGHNDLDNDLGLVKCETDQCWLLCVSNCGHTHTHTRARTSTHTQPVCAKTPTVLRVFVFKVCVTRTTGCSSWAGLRHSHSYPILTKHRTICFFFSSPPLVNVWFMVDVTLGISGTPRLCRSSRVIYVESLSALLSLFRGRVDACAVCSAYKLAGWNVRFSSR